MSVCVFRMLLLSICVCVVFASCVSLLLLSSTVFFPFISCPSPSRFSFPLESLSLLDCLGCSGILPSFTRACRSRLCTALTAPRAPCTSPGSPWSAPPSTSSSASRSCPSSTSSSEDKEGRKEERKGRDEEQQQCVMMTAGTQPNREHARIPDRKKKTKKQKIEIEGVHRGRLCSWKRTCTRTHGDCFFQESVSCMCLITPLIPLMC